MKYKPQNIIRIAKLVIDPFHILGNIKEENTYIKQQDYIGNSIWAYKM